MKKALCFLLSLLLCFSASPALAGSGNGVIMPSFPLEVAGYDLGYTDLTRFKITSVEYRFKATYSGRYDLEITLNGKKTYDRDGDTNIRFSKIRVDLYDSRRIRIASESVSTGGKWVGANLYFVSCSFYALAPGDYTLSFRDAVGVPLPPVYTPVPSPSPSPSPSPVPVLTGDVNADNVVDGRDLVRLARRLAGHGVQIDPAAADMNGDGSIDGRDLLRLCKKLAGI